MSTLVIIPTYNEKENIFTVVSGVRHTAPQVDILVADDNSPDGTGEIAASLAETDEHVHVMHRRGKEGLGAAYKAGFTWALERGYDVICEMDADGSHRPVDLPRLLARLDSDPQVGLVIGSRWVPGGSVVNWPKRREFLSRGANLYTTIMLGLGVRDATAGFRAFKAETLKAIPLAEVNSVGYTFQIDMTRRVKDAGIAIAEVPVVFVEREQGVSKMSGNIITEALVKVTMWGLKHRARQLGRLGRRITARLRGRRN